jgi:hypothetical protein
MPHEGFKSFTVKDTVYDRLQSYYQELHDPSEDSSSFSAFVTQKMASYLKERKKLRNLASKIEFVPEKFTKTTIVTDIPKGDKT